MHAPNSLSGRPATETASSSSDERRRANDHAEAGNGKARSVDVVLHSYRHRLGYAPSYPPYNQIEKKLTAQPAITVPAVTLDGLADGNFPATDGSTSAYHFTGPRVHHQVSNAGHNLPQEAQDAFANAVLELANLRSHSAGV